MMNYQDQKNTFFNECAEIIPVISEVLENLHGSTKKQSNPVEISKAVNALKFCSITIIEQSMSLGNPTKILRMFQNFIDILNFFKVLEKQKIVNFIYLQAIESFLENNAEFRKKLEELAKMFNNWGF